MEWNIAREARLRDLWKDGWTTRDIAAELGGVTRNAVIGKAHRLGLSQRPQPVKKHDEEIDVKRAERACQFIAGDICDDAHKCGETVKHGSSYCPEHHAVCWRPRKVEESA